MTKPLLRYFGMERLSAAVNMAADESLLHAAELGVASLRFYAWTAPTVSLGYFQPSVIRLQNPQIVGLEWVRRSTGGDAIVHHHELTYCLALPATAPWCGRQQKPVLMHRVIQSALSQLGITASLQETECKKSFRGVLCFEHLAIGDVMMDGHKIVGSAQRRSIGAMLQHGSILLAASPHAPSLPGITDLSIARFDASAMVDPILDSIERIAGWQIKYAAWPEDDWIGVRQVAQLKYTSDAWNCKR